MNYYYLVLELAQILLLTPSKSLKLIKVLNSILDSLNTVDDWTRQEAENCWVKQSEYKTRKNIVNITTGIPDLPLQLTSTPLVAAYTTSRGRKRHPISTTVQEAVRRLTTTQMVGTYIKTLFSSPHTEFYGSSKESIFYLEHMRIYYFALENVIKYSPPLWFIFIFWCKNSYV